MHSTLLMELMVAYRDDPAGYNMAKFITQNLEEENGIFHGKNFDLVIIPTPTISADWLEDKFHYDGFIFLSKHAAESGTLALTCHSTGNFESAKFSKKFGFESRSLSTDPNSIGTYVNEGSHPGTYFQLDTDLTQVNQLLKFIKFGFGQCMDHACYDILEGLLNREEAIELVKKYDGKCSSDYIEKFCNYIGITTQEFWTTAEKFRGNMWKKNDNGEWKNSVWELLK